MSVTRRGVGAARSRSLRPRILLLLFAAVVCTVLYTSVPATRSVADARVTLHPSAHVSSSAPVRDCDELMKAGGEEIRRLEQELVEMRGLRDEAEQNYRSAQAANIELRAKCGGADRVRSSAANQFKPVLAHSLTAKREIQRLEQEVQDLHAHRTEAEESYQKAVEENERLRTELREARGGADRRRRLQEQQPGLEAIVAEAEAELDGQLEVLNAAWVAKTKAAPGFEPGSKEDVHVWYVVDCSSNAPAYAVWQMAALENSWLRSRQPGALTRLVAGCTADHAELARLNRSVAAAASPRAGVFFVPGVEIGGTAESGYPPGNRPPAVYYWLLRGKPKESVYVAVDPDFVFISPVHTAGVRDGWMYAHRYNYLSAHNDPRNWANLATKACLQHGLEGSARGPCPAVHPDQAFEYAVGVPYVMHKRDWERVLPLWVHALPLVRRVHQAQENDMSAFAWAAWKLGMRVMHTNYTFVWPPDNQWAADGVAFSPLAWPQPSLIHYCYPADAILSEETFGELAGDDVARSFTKPGDLLSWELNRRRPLVEVAFFSKFKVPSSALVACDGPLLFEFPPLESLFRTAWYSEVGKRWLYHYQTVIKAVNAGVRQYRRLFCGNATGPLRAEGDANQKVLRTWWARGFASFGSPPLWRSAYETVADGSTQGYHYRPARWAWWKHSMPGTTGEGLRFVWKVVAARGTSVFKLRHDPSGNYSLEHPFAFLSPGVDVDAVELRKGVLRIVAPYMGWIPSAAARPDVPPGQLTQLSGG